MIRISRKEFDRRLTLYMAGLNDREIAERVKIQKASVYHWRKRNNLKTNHKRAHAQPKLIESVALELFEKGYSYREIAKKLDVSTATISVYYRKKGFKRPRGRKTETSKEEHQTIINEYHKTIKDLSWREFKNHLYINHKLDYNLRQIKTRVGLHLIRVCRAQESCAFKALLPENKPEEFNDEL